MSREGSFTNWRTDAGDSKEFADRPKDREALPELRALLARAQRAATVIPPPATPEPQRDMEL
ncbi:MAG: hypothetical protein ACYDHU_02205 [Acidimicrobiales bacterium]